jgi:hypothetical protein
VRIDGLMAPVLFAGATTLQVDIPDGVSGRAGVVLSAGGQDSDVVYVELPSVCADLNGDGVVDVDDLAILIGGWGPCP